MKNYIIDAGFASYLPLHPVPFHGDSVTSVTGKNIVFVGKIQRKGPMYLK